MLAGVRQFRLLLPLVAVAVVLVLDAVAVACPSCKESLASGHNQGDVVAGYFYSILFMLSMPFLILGGVGALMYREIRRARSLQETQT